MVAAPDTIVVAAASSDRLAGSTGILGVGSTLGTRPSGGRASTGPTTKPALVRLGRPRSPHRTGGRGCCHTVRRAFPWVQRVFALDPASPPPPLHLHVEPVSPRAAHAPRRRRPQRHIRVGPWHIYQERRPHKPRGRIRDRDPNDYRPASVDLPTPSAALSPW